MVQFEVTIPEKVSMNKVRGMNKWEWYRLAQVFHSEFTDLKGKIRVEKYPVTIHYHWHFVKNALDSLNVALMCKLLEDGMVHAEILEDDSPKFVKYSILESEKSSKYPHDTVEIKIETFIP